MASGESERRKILKKIHVLQEQCLKWKEYINVYKSVKEVVRMLICEIVNEFKYQEYA